VMSIADHATVMREGRVVWQGVTADMTTAAFVNLIASTEGDKRLDEATELSSHAQRNGGAVALDARDVSSSYLRGISVQVRKGEIVGIAGLLGSGREELPYILAGAETAGVTGTFEICGETHTELSVGRARELGVALVPADRGREGIIADFTTRENVSLAGLLQLRERAVVAPSRERRFARRWLEAVSADPGAAERRITTLSGGNQQKAVLARWLSVSPKVLLLSEPTAGVDVGARAVIYQELRKRAEEGLAVLMASSDVEDLLAVCDRVIVLRDGTVVRELERSQMNKPAIIGAMEGVPSDQQG
jgi:ribose transport system ATP-binding protein